MIHRLAAHPGFPRLVRHVVPPIDLALSRATHGRVFLSKWFVPTLVLTTTGARSGLVRESPLATQIRTDGTFVVVGSNYGEPRHPAWSVNLLADPRARVTTAGRSVDVTARLLAGEERSALWEELLVVWPPYATYEQRAGRELRVFVLEPVDAGSQRSEWTP
jgi:deazaflavin-dependent oxidoreductase (nitroreductase family)